MASGDSFTVNLTGTKNGANRNFTFPVTPNQTQNIWVFQAGKTLYPVQILDAAGPVTELLRYKLTGTVDVEVGIAPGANDDLWAQGSEA